MFFICESSKFVIFMKLDMKKLAAKFLQTRFPSCNWLFKWIYFIYCYIKKKLKGFSLLNFLSIVNSLINIKIIFNSSLNIKTKLGKKYNNNLIILIVTWWKVQTKFKKVGVKQINPTNIHRFDHQPREKSKNPKGKRWWDATSETRLYFHHKTNSLLSPRITCFDFLPCSWGCPSQVSM